MPGHEHIYIPRPDEQVSLELRSFLNSRCVTDGGLGILGDYLIKLAGIQGQAQVKISPPAVVLFAADHGVIDESVSNFTPGDTEAMLAGILSGKTAVSVLAGYHGLTLSCWDVGLKGHPRFEGQKYSLQRRRIAQGTRNFVYGPAMSREQCLAAVAVGREAISELGAEVTLVALGELGMGNTTSAAAMTAALLKQPPEQVVGTGAGHKNIRHKTEVVARALAANTANLTDALSILAALGGLEIAALVGACLQAASLRKGIILDGFVTGTAALVASEINPLVKNYLFASHLADEPGHRLVLRELELDAPMQLNLKIGEGAGGLLLWPLLQQAEALGRGLAGFAELGVNGN